ncbi:MAG: hypothetical protein ACRDSP_12195 [Pseudonocardiaceae bacterium]
MPPVHRWVVPGEDAVREVYRVSFVIARRGLDARDLGAINALYWVTIGEVSPVGQQAVEATWERARAESWLALCLAAGQELPTERDWQRLGAEPYPAVRTDPAYCYGAWRTLAWLLGVRDDWPVHTAWHRAAELPQERPHTYVSQSQRDTEAWRVAAEASAERDRQDALLHWRHIRERADATG